MSGKITSQFFEDYGKLGGIDRNYDSYMRLIQGQDPLFQEVGNRLVYRDNPSIWIPKQTRDGTYILDNKERYFMSQEIKMNTEFFIAIDEDMIICSINVNSMYHPFILRYSLDGILVDLKSIRKDLRIPEPIIPLRGIFGYLGYSLDDVTDVLRRMLDPKFANMARIVLEMGLTSELDEEQGNIMKAKVFSDCTNEQMFYTIVVGVSHCLRRKVSERDSYQYKILRSAPYMFYKSVTKFLKTKEPDSISSFIKSLKTGSLTVQGKTYQKMASVISRRSELDAISCIRKVVIATNENSPNMVMRNIHDSQRGFICPCETSDGKNAGLSKYLAVMCVISGPFTEREDLVQYIRSYQGDTYVILDGLWICKTSLTRDDIKTRYDQIGVYLYSSVLYIRTIDGRPMRLVRHKKSGRLSFIDPAEQLYHMTDYLEVSPMSMLGLSAVYLPYSNHNQSARVVFACNMLKQAVESRPPSEFYEEHRRLIYGQRPMIETEVKSDVPYGVNTVVAISTYKGFNQEDSIVINKGALERGLFHMLYYKNVSRVVDMINEEVRLPNSSAFCIIEGSKEKHMTEIRMPIKGDKYKLIGEDRIELELETKEEITYKFEEYRVPEVGDKVASRHAQKSIIGLIVPSEDMPVTETGIVPDLIINPHAIPSRMTIGQLIESLEGKIGALEGEFKDGTPFTERLYLDQVDQGTEYLIDGCTGEYISNAISIGIVYYMALKQQVRDKMFSRYEGPINEFSRQPTTGKSKEGGLRIGEMEYDALIAHEAYTVLNQIIDQSDAIDVRICKTCKKRIHNPCPRDHDTVVTRVPMSRIVTEDLLAGLGIGIQTDVL
jgi:hypothetical protein